MIRNDGGKEKKKRKKRKGKNGVKEGNGRKEITIGYEGRKEQKGLKRKRKGLNKKYK